MHQQRQQLHILQPLIQQRAAWSGARLSAPAEAAAAHLLGAEAKVFNLTEET